METMIHFCTKDYFDELTRGNALRYNRRFKGFFYEQTGWIAKRSLYHFEGKC